MQHLSSKVLAAIVACSAALMFSGMNVSAANVNHDQRPVATHHASASAQDKLNSLSQSSQRWLVHGQMTHRYTYQKLNQVKAQQVTARLGSHRGRRSAKRTKKVNHRRNQKTNRKAQKRGWKRTRRRKVSNNPQVAYLSKRNVKNQKKSAVNHFSKKISYVENPQPANFTSSEQYGDSDYARTGTPIVSNDGQLTFRRLTFIPKKLGKNQFYSPQGLVVAGHYAYVIINATNSYEASHKDDTDSSRQTPASYVDGDLSTGTSPYKLGASQILRVDLRHNVKDYNTNLKAARRNIAVGKVFYGGHGQGLAYNPKTRQLWLLDNKQGQVTKTGVSLINLRTLVPKLRVNFRFGNTTIGDDLAFDRKGNALNVTEAGSDSFATNGAVKVFAGRISPKGVNMRLVKQALRWAPSDVIQGLAYNSRNNRLYILGDDAVTSIPVNRLGHLKPKDVWYTPFNTTREFEGLSFDSKGNGYLLVSRSPEILKARYNRNLKF